MHQTTNLNVTTPTPINNNVNVALAYPPQHAHSQSYHSPAKPSATFAIITFVLYIFGVTFPLAAILNIVGLIAGPRRGLFALMFFFILMPTTLLGIVFAIAAVVSGA